MANAESVQCFRGRKLAPWGLSGSGSRRAPPGFCRATADAGVEGSVLGAAALKSSHYPRYAAVKKIACLVLTCTAMVMAKDAELTQESNGTALFPPKKSSHSCIQMNGKEVFRFAVRCVPQSIEARLDEDGVPSSSIDWLLLHQANQRMIDAVSTWLEIPADKVISNLSSYRKPRAASIPLALDEVVRSGKLQTGNTIATGHMGFSSSEMAMKLVPYRGHNVSQCFYSLELIIFVYLRRFGFLIS